MFIGITHGKFERGIVFLHILVLTSIYPQSDDDENAGITSVVHYFAREWVASGNNVMVIHNANKYPRCLYLLPISILNKINAIIGMVIPKNCQRKNLVTEKDGIKIFRIPLLKIIPKGKFFEFQIKNQFKKIVEIINECNFIPDVVIGHWENPQIPLLSMLKQNYGCKTALVFHGVNYLKQKSCAKWNIVHMKNIDVLGCRSKPIAEDVKGFLKLDKDPFICYSGIPGAYIEQFTSQKPKIFSSDKLRRFIFTGQLIQRKYVDSIIKALHQTNPDKNFHLNIVGIGACDAELRDLVEKLDLQEQVEFSGRVPRDEVVRLMQDIQCFTMISRDEAFGLVYIEAMASGCIVVASKNEGIDGVIVNGMNGFLSTAGDEKELAKIYKRINDLTKEQKEQISQNAIETARNFKDSDAAIRYLDNVLNV